MRIRTKLWKIFLVLTTISYFIIAASKIINDRYVDSIFSLVTSFLFLTAFIGLESKKIVLDPNKIANHFFNLGFILQIFGVSYIKYGELDVMSILPWGIGIILFSISLYKLKVKRN